MIGVLCLLACSSGHDAAPPRAEDAAPETEAALAIDAAPRDDGAPEAATTTILSLNLHCLKNEGFASTAERFAAIAALANRENVAALAVQEACVARGEDAMKILAAELSRATGASWSRTWKLAHRAWEGTPDEADEGVGLLVRGAMTGEEAITHRVQTALTRVAVSAMIGDVRVYSVHFDHQNADARTMQARELAVRALVESEPGFAAIVAGDFNARAGNDAHAAFTELGFRDLSSSGGIDHVVVHRGAGLFGAGRLVLDGRDGPRVSDHPGVLVTVTRGPREPATATRIVARASLASGDWLSLRGGAPLSWTRGWPAHRTARGFELLLTEIASPFEVKVLRNEQQWMDGPNVSVAPGALVTIDPTFGAL